MAEAVPPEPYRRAMSGNLRGIGWMVLTGLCFVAVTGSVRYLGSDMAPVQAAFIRYVLGVALLLPVFLRLRPGERLSRRLGLHALRGVVHGMAVILWFYAMARIPIADVAALGFTAPIFTAIGAALFLGEKIRAHRLGAILIGFLGVLIILRPGIDEVSLGALAQLSAAPCFAASYLIAKRLTDTESSGTVVCYLSVVVTLMLLPPALFVWRTPTLTEWGWLTATAAFATLGHYTMTRAFHAAEITAVQPVMFLQLVWATLLGLAAFGETPDAWTWLGGAVVVASATYIARREALARRAAAGLSQQAR